MTQSATAAQRLVQYWRSLGCILAPGVSEQGLTDFENTHSVRLPADLREYFTLCNGLEFGAAEKWNHGWLEMIAFWPLSEVTSLDPHDMLPKQVGSPSSYFMFADFLIHSHVYAIRLTTDPNAPCPVIFYGDMPYVYKLGDSFSDFTTLYLNNPDHVLSPPESLYFRM